MGGNNINNINNTNYLKEKEKVKDNDKNCSIEKENVETNNFISQILISVIIIILMVNCCCCFFYKRRTIVHDNTETEMIDYDIYTERNQPVINITPSHYEVTVEAVPVIKLT